MNKLSIDQIDLAGKRVFIRVDFNVPLDNGAVSDDTRIRAAIPTIRYAIDAGAKVIVASHLGRPKGEVKPQFSLRQIIDTVSAALGAPVAFVDDCVGEKATSAAAKLKYGEVLLLENVRFHKEETENDKDFAASLASLADVYVNDAFGTAHRAHASTEGVAHILNPAVAGFLLKKEIDYFNKTMVAPQRPLAVILGGAKVSTKLSVVGTLVDKCDILMIGGAMAFTFLKALNFDMGRNIVEEDMVEKIMGIMAKSRRRKQKLYLPVDFIVTDSIDSGVAKDVVTRQDLTKDMIAADIGPATTELFKLGLKTARTIAWNGPMGVFEKPAFAGGTIGVAEAMAKSEALTVVGGGDSVTAVNKAGLADSIDFISTGGGAFLEMMEGKTLPGIAALTDAS